MKLISLLGALLALTCTAEAEAAPRAKLDTGVVAGLTTNGAEAFLGLPYAAPPVGELRWAPPSPVKPWTGTRPAVAMAVQCSAPPSGDGPRVVNEDCLYLNVYRPIGAKPGGKLPVMVFLHGGGAVTGSPGVYDGARMASVGKAVVVIPAFRIGVFGALASPGAGTVGGGYVVQDWIAVLSWVKRNATALGGDPASVTLSGQSSGGGAVCALLTAPAAAGLFQQAIIQSTGCGRPITLVKAQDAARDLGMKVGCPGTDLACLRKVDPGRLLDAWSQDFGAVNGPAVGSATLPVDPVAAISEGHFHRMPVLIGFTHDELWEWQHELYPLSEEGFRAAIASRFGENASAVTERYRTADFPHIEYALGAALGDRQVICRALTTAGMISGQAPVSVYEFADRSMPAFKSLGAAEETPPGYSAGAYHTAELKPLLGYNSAGEPLNAAQRERGDELIRRWVAFGRGKAWPPYPGAVQRSDEKGASLETAATVAADHRCDLWAK